MNHGIQVTDEAVMSHIYVIRGMNVMIDNDLAKLYGVETKVLNQAVSRNLLRFPADFRFQLSDSEFENLRSQIVTSSWGGRRTNPYVFTEQGVAMLSSVLNSDRAILVNIHIIRVFTKMREMLSTHKDVLTKLDQLERKVIAQDQDIKVIFKYLRELLNPPAEPIRRIGFKRGNEG